MNTASVQLNRIWNKVKGVLPKRRWLLVMLVIFGGLTVAGIFGGVHGVFANSDEPGFWISLFAKICFGLAGLFMQMAIFFLEFFIDLAKYNNYINADVVKLGWLMVRDVCNMFFVVILLVIAIGTIMGIEQYEWKKTLVKFVLAAVFINFSKLIFGLIIDVAHVFTITFLNAVAAIAGGNLISMFKFESMMKMMDTNFALEKGTDNFSLQIWVSSILALVFSAVAMVAIGAYAIVMVARVVVLWVLIILSPLAFVLQVIPQTQSYGKQIWDKFGKQVMVAPVMVFFLWLAFATLGAGDVATRELGMQNSSYSEAGSGVKLGGNALSISDVSSWENVASFLIAIGFLLVGINVVQGMGVVAGGLVQKAQDFAGSVAKVATGYALGRKIVGGAASGVTGLASKGLKEGSKAIGLAMGGQALINTGKRIGGAFITNKALNWIPVVGGYSKIRRERIAENLDKTLKLKRETMKMNLKRPENLSAMDELGTWMFKKTEKVFGKGIGFGQESQSWKKYDAEEQEAQAMLRKKSSAEQRAADRDAKNARLAAKAINSQVDPVKKELEAEQDKFIAGDDNFKELKKIDELAGEVKLKIESDATNKYAEAYKDWQLANSKIDSPENRKSFEDQMLQGKNLDEFKEAELLEKLKEENEQRQSAGEQAFLATDKGKALLGKQRKFNDIAQDVAENNIEMFDEEGKPMNREARAAVAARIRHGEMLSQLDRYKAEKDQAEKELKGTVVQTAIGRENMIGQNIAEQAAKAAEAFTKSIKEADLQVNFDKAKEALSKLKLDFGNDPKRLEAAMHDLASKNTFVRVIQQEEEQKATEAESKAAKAGAEREWDMAEGADWVKYYGKQDEIDRVLKKEKEQGADSLNSEEKEIKNNAAAASRLIAKIANKEELSDDEKAEVEKLREHNFVKPQEETQRMRMAGAEVASAGVASYFETVERNAPRNKESADRLAEFDELINQASGDTMSGAVLARNEKENKENKWRRLQSLAGEGGQREIKNQEITIDAKKKAVELARKEKNANPTDTAKLSAFTVAEAELTFAEKALTGLKDEIQGATPEEIKKANEAYSVASADYNVKNAEWQAQMIQNPEIGKLMTQKEDFLKTDPYAAKVFYDQKAKMVKAQVTEQEQRAVEQFGGTKIGEQIIKALADAEIGATVGEDFLKKVKNDHWTKKFDDARETMIMTLGEKDKKERDKKLDELGKSDKYVRALKLGQESKMADMFSKNKRADAESAADNIYGIGTQMGLGTPSTGRDNLADQLGKNLNKYSEAARGRAGAINIRFIAKAVEDGNMSESKAIAMYGLLKNLIEQGNFDDMGDALAGDINRYERGEVTDEGERADVEAMMRLFGPEGEFGVIKRYLKINADGQVLDRNGERAKDRDGKVIDKKYEIMNDKERAGLTTQYGLADYEGSDETVNVMQNWMLSGANTKLLRTDRAIKQFQTEHHIDDYSKAAKQWFADDYSKMGEDKKKGFIDEFSKVSAGDSEGGLDALRFVLQKNETSYHEASNGFKEDSLNKTLHTENAFQTIMDPNLGALRPATIAEVRAVGDGNLRKKTGGLAQTNVHSLGTWTGGRGLLRKLNLFWNASHSGAVGRKQEAAGRKDRTRRGALAQGGSEDARKIEEGRKEVDGKDLAGYAVYAGGFGSTVQKFGDFDHLVAENLMSHLLGGLQMMAIDMQQEYKNTTWQRADGGEIKVVIETKRGALEDSLSSGKNEGIIVASHTSDLVEEMGRRLENNIGVDSAKIVKLMLDNGLREYYAKNEWKLDESNMDDIKKKVLELLGQKKAETESLKKDLGKARGGNDED